MWTLSSSESGSTLLELCVCVALGSILIGGATLSIANLFKDPSEKKIANEVVTFFEQSALSALRSQETLSITLTQDQLKETFKTRVLNLPSSYNYTLRFGGVGKPNVINFYPSGSSSAGTLTIEGEDNTCVISQTISGARRIVCSRGD